MAENVNFPSTSVGSTVSFVNADGTTAKTLLATADNVNGSTVRSIGIANSDSSSIVVNFYKNDGTSDHLIFSFNVDAYSGYYSSVNNPPFFPTQLNLLNGYLDSNSILDLRIPVGYGFKVAVGSAVPATKLVTVDVDILSY
jgi:hypothetical protein